MGSRRSTHHKHAVAHPKGVVSRRGDGALQWNAESWFGALAGGTLWLLAGAFMVMGEDGLLGLVLLLLCGAGVVFGVQLWRRRATLRPHAATQLLIAGLFVMAALALGAFAWRDRMAELTGSSGGPSPAWWLLVYPGVSLMMWLQDRK